MLPKAVDPGWFDVIVESATVGLRKPDPEIYHHTLEKLNCQPADAIFLDDIGQNLKTAKNLGFRATIKVENPAEAVDELESVLGFSLKNFRPGTLAIRPGMQIDLNRLKEFLQPILGPASQVTARQFGHGQSNPTYFIDYGGQELVLRKKPV